MQLLVRGFQQQKVEKRRCCLNCKVIGFLLVGYLLLNTFFPTLKPSAFDGYKWQKPIHPHQNVSLTEVNKTCAELILQWCLQNGVDSSNCSWTIGTFRNHFYSMASLISRPFPDSANNNSGVALIRLGDGEMKLMFGIAVVSTESDHWSWPGGKSRLGQDLKDLMRIPKQPYNSVSPVYYGIYDANEICPFHELLTMVFQHPRYLTYTNLFVNSNYPATKLLHHSLIRDEKKKIILIINNETSQSKLAELNEWAAEILQFPHNGPLIWENGDVRNQAITKITLVASRYKNRLFAFSVGPLSRVLIHYAWLQNPYNRYIDFGSTFDQRTKDKFTRPYQSDTEKIQDPTYIVSFNETIAKFHVNAVN